MTGSVYLRARLGGDDSAAAGGYSIQTAFELGRVLKQISGNIDVDRDMAAEAVAEYLRYRLPDLAVLYPRHSFGFSWREVGSCVTVSPHVHGAAWLDDVFRYVQVNRTIQRLRVDITLARALTTHLTDVSRDLKMSWFRLLPPIAPRGIDFAHRTRVERMIARAMLVLNSQPVPYVRDQKPWGRCGEHERRQMLVDCGWI